MTPGAHASPTPPSAEVPVGPRLGDEVRGQLHRCLRLLAPLLLLYCLFHVLRNASGRYDPPAPALGLVVQATLLVLLGVAALSLCLTRSPSWRHLRGAEMALFGLAAALLAWRHACALAEAVALGAALPTAAPVVFRLALGASAARWLLLVLAYATLVPNTVRRCAVVVSALAVVPLLITALVALVEVPVSEALARAMPPIALTLGAGGALALFACQGLHRAPAAVLEGQTLGAYRLIERLRVGGMGEVFLAEHLLLRRRAAVKRMRPVLARDPALQARFEREAVLLARVHHPHVVAIHDAGRTEDGTCYYAMEHVPGPSLGELVAREGPLAPDRVACLLRQAAEAVHATHAAGLLHLDVTPSNLLTGGDAGETIKLIDFGLALEFTELLVEAPAVPCGSPAYMSPEQAAGRGRVGPRSDVYSLGAVGYFLLTGAPPFVREGPVPTLLAHALDGVTPPGAVRPGVPAELQAIILRCLAKDPTERYPTAAALAEALARCPTAPSNDATAAPTAGPTPVPTPTDAVPPAGLVFTPIPGVELTSDEPAA